MDQKRIALITGATAGIGRHAALYLAARGFRVIATGRNQDALAELAVEGGGDLTPLRLDVTDQASIDSAVEVVDRITGGHGLDVLVNNAGYGDIAPMETTTDKDLRAVFDTNVFGLMAVTRAFLPRMRERGKGRIVNVSSLGGLFTLPLFGAYNATKHAVESISDALRIELRPFGIEVSLIEPGPIKTKFSTSSLKSVERYQDGSPYAPVLARFADLTRRTDKMAPGPKATSRAIHHAASSRWPRSRYKLTLSSRLTVAFLRAIPTRWSDALLRRILRLTPKHLIPASPKAKSELTTSRAA
ncbi:MAG TPA: SDR family oxidoreductase [Kofleriaceae bacterium]|jgi:NAD(P)-dependent dehydrogenase (short-subunit alcohol dehydrogenase family)